ncbi:hypothetical protein TNCV_180601 [Trichonephila clavipes]|nr:hypothetical protein TNCV_180601 [Trichonephila clavipes]
MPEKKETTKRTSAYSEPMEILTTVGPGKNAAYTVGMVRQVFNDDVLENHMSASGFCFKSGNMTGPLASGRLLTGRNGENIAKINRAIDENYRKTIDQISEERNVP